MTNLHSILKSRDITFPAKVHLVKAMVFPVVMYGCESWTTSPSSFPCLLPLTSFPLPLPSAGSHSQPWSGPPPPHLPCPARLPPLISRLPPHFGAPKVCVLEQLGPAPPVRSPHSTNDYNGLILLPSVPSLSNDAEWRQRARGLVTVMFDECFPDAEGQRMAKKPKALFRCGVGEDS